eukprot:TRINITY_DN6431_c0_g1_i7.p1 TRINITY_DN6431_c0_g1~~TRINITY_DN6431_c0_g1_i7.p1  ORF type:complete len:373 (+),score=89.40 TRINITY_DN6431_c0_g1_i7:101-1219(+)
MVQSENVVLDKKNQPRLIDFGCAMAKDGSDRLELGTAEVVGAGSPAYHAPELLRAEDAFDGAECSDLWALAVMAFNLLTAELPFTADSDGSPFLSVAIIWSKISRVEISWPKTPLDSQAESFIKNVLVANLEKRLGCTAEGGVDYPSVKSHSLFAQYRDEHDWSALPVPPIQVNSTMNQEARTSSQRRTKHHSTLTQEPTAAELKSVIQRKDMLEYDRQTNTYKDFLLQSEKILYTGPLTKYVPWRVPREREFCLVVEPVDQSITRRTSTESSHEKVEIVSARIIYVDSDKWQKMGEISLDADTCAVAFNDKDLQITTRNRVYVLQDKLGKAKDWQSWIATTLRQIYGSSAHVKCGHDHPQEDQKCCNCTLL